jgi:hypothetical protein
MKTKYKRRHDEFDGRRSFFEEWKLHRDLNKARTNPAYTTSLKINEKDLGSSAPAAEENRTTLAQSLAGIKSIADLEKKSYTLIQEYGDGKGNKAKVTLDKVLDNKKIADFMRKHPGGNAELYFRTLDKKDLPMTIAKSGKPDRAGPLDDFAKSGFGKEITKTALDHIRMTMEKFKELEAKQRASGVQEPESRGGEEKPPESTPQPQSPPLPQQSQRTQQPDRQATQRRPPSAFSQPDSQQLRLNFLQEQKFYYKELLRLSSEESKLLSPTEPPRSSPTVPERPLDTPLAPPKTDPKRQTEPDRQR